MFNYDSVEKTLSGFFIFHRLVYLWFASGELLCWLELLKSRLNQERKFLILLKSIKKDFNSVLTRVGKRKLRMMLNSTFVYHDLRDMGLTSQLAVRCIKQACGMLMKSKSKPSINNVSVGFPDLLLLKKMF